MDNLDITTIIVIIISITIVLAILFWIIRVATRNSPILKLERMQASLLIEIALKSGVEKEVVNEIIDKHNKA